MAHLVINKSLHVWACPQGNIFGELCNVNDHSAKVLTTTWRYNRKSLTFSRVFQLHRSLVPGNLRFGYFASLEFNGLPNFKVLPEVACRVNEFNFILKSYSGGKRFLFQHCTDKFAYLITKKSSFAPFGWSFLFSYALFFWRFIFFAFRSRSSPVHLKWSLFAVTKTTWSLDKECRFLFSMSNLLISIYLKHN